jgi:hypothetical protein
MCVLMKGLTSDHTHNLASQERLAGRYHYRAKRRGVEIIELGLNIGETFNLYNDNLFSVPVCAPFHADVSVNHTL